MSHRVSKLCLSLTLALLLSPAAGMAQQCLGYAAFACFGKNKIQYKAFDWRIYHSPHFDVYYYPEEEQFLQHVVSIAESAYDQLSRELDHQITDPITLIFYETHADFEQNNIIRNFIPEGVGAFAVPTRNRMVLPIDLPGNELMSLMRHELTHVFQFEMVFQGRGAKAFTAQPPQWFMEGMASYFGRDETARDKGFLRDAVVNDRIPPVSQTQGGGFFAYRFGHAVFDYMEERWGLEGVRDFVIESRNSLGGNIGRAFDRAFGVEPEDFDADFRRWLRRKYLPELVESGEPGDFGRLFRRPQTIFSGQMTSPAASPSGDLVAAFSTFKGDVDVVLYDAQERTFLRNLTKGFDQRFQYLVAQEFTLGRKMGRDLAFSPDGNLIALFARRGASRQLVLLDVLKGGIYKLLDLQGVDQPFSPTWSVDGRRVAFSGYRAGRFDIFAVDIADGTVSKITDDDVYDASPVFSPDGESIVVTSVVGDYAKLYRIDLDEPGIRTPLTFGETNDTDAVFTNDGRELFFTSDRTGADNIYSLDLETDELTQHTDAVTIAFQPTVLSGIDGEAESLVYSAFWKGRFDLYRLDFSEPITEGQSIERDEEANAPEAFGLEDLKGFTPSIEVAIDDANKEKSRAFKFFLEDLDLYAGVSDDQTVIGQFVISFTDYLGDRRMLGLFQSIESFQNFDFIYSDNSRRWGWNLHLFDNQDFFITRDILGDFRRLENAIQETGLIGSLTYPINPNHRFTVGTGYIARELNFPIVVDVPLPETPDGMVDLDGLIELVPGLDLILQGLSPDEIQAVVDGLFPNDTIGVLVSEPRDDDYPILTAALVGDSSVFAPWGPITGRRWRLSGSWAPDTAESGTLTSDVTIDFRQYLRVTARSNFAFRAWGSVREGNFPTPMYFGGLDTVRGYDFRSLVGDRGFFANFEFRFPLFDALATPVINFGGVRAVLFLDVGGAWLDDFQDFDVWDSENDRLDDAVASYGYGLTARVFGLDLNFDFAKRWDGETSADGYESSFWIGTRF